MKNVVKTLMMLASVIMIPVALYYYIIDRYSCDDYIDNDDV